MSKSNTNGHNGHNQQADHAEPMTHQEAVKKLGELVKDIRMAMLTTVHEDGTLHSRPMATQDIEFDGDLWFFTGVDTSKVDDVRRTQQVNVAYASPSDHRYVSIEGEAEIVNDRAKMKSLWSPAYKVWFPEGLDDPRLRLMKIHVTGAEYWDTPGGMVSVLAGFLKSVVTGHREKMGDNQTLEI